MDGRPTWTDCDEAGDYVVPNVLSPRDLVFRPDNMDETVPHTTCIKVHPIKKGPESVDNVIIIIVGHKFHGKIAANRLIKTYLF